MMELEASEIVLEAELVDMEEELVAEVELLAD